MDLDKNKFINLGLVGDLRLYAYELDEIVNPTLCYEHTESGWYEIKHLLVSPNSTDEAIVKKIQEFKRV